MRRFMRSWWPPALLATVLALVITGPFWAGGPKNGPMAKSQDEQISNVLKEVINKGADLFNQQRDFSGCYRLYEGALLAVRPQLSAHPELQKSIDKGLADAAANPSVVQRAFTLRRITCRRTTPVGTTPC